MKRILLLFGMVTCWTFANAQCPAISTPVALPFSDGFETYSGPNQFFTDTNFICTNSYSWSYEEAGTSGILTLDTTVGPSTNSGSKAAILSGGSGSSGVTNDLILTLNMSAYDTLGNDIFLRFYFADMWDEADAEDRVWVRGNDTATWIEIYNWSTLNNSGVWEEVLLNITDFLKAADQDFSATTQFRWSQNDNSDYYGNSSGDGLGIDDVSILQSTCNTPGNLTATSGSAGSVNFSWTTGGASNWQISYDTIGKPAGANITGVTSTASTTVSGLSEGVTYDFYVRDSCGTGDVSFWEGPVAVKVSCNSTTAPYYNDFETDFIDEPPLCWESYETYSGSFVEVEDFTGAAAPYSGSQALYLYSSSADPADDTLIAITPQFTDLTAGDKQIRFYGNSDDPADQLIVGTIPSPVPGATFTPLDTITFQTADTYEEVRVPITTANGYNGTDQYIVLAHNLAVTTDYIRIDEFHYEEIPPCPKVTGIVLDSVGIDWASFSFNGAGGTSFGVEFGPAGFSQGTGCTGTFNGTSITIDNTTDISCATQLAGNTTYDIYIRNDCSGGGNGVSAWQGPFTFTTLCGVYTAPYTNNFENEELDELPGCWEYYESYSSAYVEVEDNNTAYSGDQTLLLYNSGGDMPDDTLLAISPEFDDLDLGDKQISFYSQVSDAAISLIVGTMPSPTATTDLHPLDTITFTQADAYKKSIVLINSANGYNGTDRFVYFMHGGEITYEDIDIDDFVYEPAPTCLPPGPNSLGVSSVTYNSADVFWGPGGAGYKTYINWGGPGFTPGFGSGAGIDSVSGSTDAYNITGLSAATNYEFYVQDSCIADGLSPWVGPFALTTDCAPQVAPFVEGFETSSATRDCWTNEFIVGNKEWEFGTGSSSSAASITTAHGGTENARLPYSYGNFTTRFVSPPIDVSGLTVPYLKFYYAQEEYTSDHGTMTVYVRDYNSPNWIQVFFDDTELSSWTLAELVLPSTNSDTIVIAFEGYQDLYGRDNLLDDVQVVEGPACPDVGALDLSNLTDTSATFHWIGNANATSYQVWLGPAGFYQGSQTVGGHQLIAPFDSLVLDTLTPSTCYEFAVRSICSGGDTSEWTSLSYTFCTPCPSYVAPYFENFDGTTDPDIDDCWTVIDQTSSSSSRIETYDGTAPTAYSNPNSVEFYNSGASSGDLILVSPYLSDLDNTKLVRLKVFDESSGGDLVIGTLSNPEDPLTFTAYETIPEADMEDDKWQEVRVLLNSYTGTDHYIGIKFDFNSTYSYLYVDNFQYETVTCPYPSNLDSTGNTTTSVGLSWTTGGASDWQIEYGPAGFTPGSGTLVNVSTNPYTLGALSPGTLYDVYVRDSCGAGDVSLWTGPVTVYTDCSGPVTTGTYTIGAGGDYTSFTEVSDALNICGISGPVTFNILPGKYTDKLHLLGIPGVYSGVPGLSATNTITFNGSGSDTLVWSGQGPQAAVLLDNSGHVTFNNMTIVNMQSSEAWGILLTNNSDSVTIDSCTVVMDSTSSGSDRAGIIVTGDYENDLASGADVDHLTITNSTIVGGYYGIALQGDDASNLSVGHKVSGNTIRHYYYGGIDLDDVEDVEVTGNIIIAAANASSAADGIYAYDVNDFNIDGNYVHTPDYGIYVYDGNDGFTTTTFSTIINNMVISTGDYGIYLNDAVEIDVYHNTVKGEPALAINDDEDLNIMNNIFSTVDDFAFESVDAIDASTLVDYNLYYKTGTGDIADDGSSTYATLAAWQTGDATRNANSVEGNPLFVSADDLHLLGGLANDAGDNAAGVTVDFDGDTRPASGASAVDIGADEYTPLAGDLALIKGGFIKGLCLSANDSIELWVQNLIDPVDFSADSLTAIYTVSGPVNSSGTLTIKTGTLGTLDTLVIYAGNIDLSLPGLYTLSAYIDSNGVNVLTMNDTLADITLEVAPEFVVNPEVVTLASMNDSVRICAESPYFGTGDFFITEVSHYAGVSLGGPTAGRPSWLVADDYIEITGAPGSDLVGYTLEQWNGSSLVVSYTFPSNTILGPNGTAIIATGQMNGSTPSPSDFYYHGNGSFTGTWGSSSGAGRILKDPGGNIVDAVVYDDSYSFPASAGVSAADWSGSVPNSDFSWGIRLEGPDLNSATGWVASENSPQDPNTVNSGVPVPVPMVTGLTWTLNGTQVDTSACTVVGPFTTPGTYEYVATFSHTCGNYSDTVTVIVPTCTAPANLSGLTVSANSVSLSWDTVGTGVSNFEVIYGPTGFDPANNGTLISSITDSTTVVTGLAPNLCQEYYVRTRCSATDSSIWIGPVTVCPDVTICTDDMEQYATGLIEGQSSLFLPWQGSAGAAGTASISTAQASSGTQSLYLSNPTGNSADNDDLIAYFDTINSGIWEISFDMYVPTGHNAYFNIQQNHDFTGSNNLWGGEIYFQGNGTAEVEYGSSTVAGTFSYTQGQWNTVSTIIDIVNDSIWFELNGTSTGVGYDYSLANGLPLQFNGVNFYTGKRASDVTSSEFYIDDFCVTPYTSNQCLEPVGLAAGSIGCDTVELSWTSLSGNTNNSSIIEYGPTGFTPGTGGTFVSYVNSPHVITALTPGTTYDFYVADTCGTSDTSSYSGPVSFTTATGPLPQASFTATINGYDVTFDASGSSNASDYNWDFGDGNNGTGNLLTHTYATGGNFTVQLTAGNGCGTDDTTIVVAGVSVEENALQRSLEIFPNPTSGSISVVAHTASAAKASIRITDVSGRELKRIDLDDLNGHLKTRIDISDLSKGVYLLRVSAGELNALQRVIRN